jgi:hypothetical protein
MVQLKTYARLVLLVVLFSMWVGKPITGVASKTLDAHRSSQSVGSAPSAAPGPLIELWKPGLGPVASGASHYPEVSAATSRGNSGGVFSEESAERQSDEFGRMSHHCLALNVYWEARNQALSGQLAVAQVTMNRVRDPRYPDDICEVVYDHRQFSWYWDGLPDSPREPHAWVNALLVASAAIHGTGHAELDRVTHYHAVYSQPYWKDSMTLVTTIGDHVFYIE